jgi:methionyl-tRNA formyltransferase
VAYGQILKQDVIDLPRLGCINIHSSLLPRWRGAAPIQWALIQGDSESGVTTMRIVRQLDAGDILIQRSTPISDRETAESLHDRLSLMGGDLIVETLSGVAAGKILPRVQDESQVTYAHKLDKAMEVLDPSLGAAVLDRKIRALNPWPGTSVWLSKTGDRIKIKEARPYPQVNASRPLGLFERSGMLFLGTEQGSLEVVRLQQDGKKESDAAAFLNGLRGRGQSLPLEVSFTPPCKEK